MTRARRIELRLVGLPLVRPFRTSFGVSTQKVCILVRIETDHAEGWGECVADVEPDFSYEFNSGVWELTRELLAPALFRAGDVAAHDLTSVFGFVKGNPMAKASLVNAFLDAELKEKGEHLSAFLGGVRDRVECGVSLGITDTVDTLRDQVIEHLEQGYRRIKLKITPGIDVDRVSAIRGDHPEILLSVDANAAYTLEQTDVFKALDAFGLLMVEQPLHHQDLVMHARLQEQISTALCLDESIRDAADAAAAISLGACRIVNIKQGRVGGILEARRVHDVCSDAGVPVWCGGMLETGIGRATNLALASMPNFTLPGDTSASARYFEDDITEPFVLAHDGTMDVPHGPGIGVAPRPDRLEACTIRHEAFGG